MSNVTALTSATRVTRPEHDRDGARRKPYSKPRNRRRDAIKSQQAARALSWQAGIVPFGERLRLARQLDRWRLQFVKAGNRALAAEMQQLRRDVLRHG